MTAGNRYDLRVPRGDDWELAFGFVDLAGASVDMTGRQLTATILATLATAPVAVDLSASDTGLVVLSLPASTTTLLPSRARWQLMQNLPGRVATLLDGYLVVVEG